MICIIGIFLIGSVSACDLNENAIVDLGSFSGENDISVGETEDNSIDELSANGDVGIISTNYVPKNSSEIQSCIDSADEEDTIVLDGYYLISNTINVGKKLTFVGVNDATVDGNNKIRLFSVSNSDVTFKNITFKNGKSTIGGAVNSGIFFNCTFINNYASGNGGAVNYCRAEYCTFINNYAGSNGGAIGDSSKIHRCRFINNSAGGKGGAIYVDDYGPTIKDSLFINNSAGGSGGAIFGRWADGVYVVNCTFIHNSANSGGAVSSSYYWRKGLTVTNSSFINNSAVNGGGIYAVSNTEVEDSSFINNSATGSGGAIYNDGGYVFNCNFTGNSAKLGGGVYSKGSKPVGYSNFINNSAERYGAIYALVMGSNCIFINNYANQSGCISNSLLEIDNEGYAVLGEYKNLTLKLYGPGGYLSNKRIIFSVNDKNYTMITNDEGLVIISYLDYFIEIGQYNISAKFLDDESYEGISANSSVTILSSKGVLNNTFSAIQNAINVAADGDNITLNGYYVNDCNSVITVNKLLNFIGTNNTILDANKSSRIFHVTSDGVTFTNITFKNGIAGGGGAIFFKSYGNILNCSFINNSILSSFYEGSAVYFGATWTSGGYGSVVNSKFINNTAYKKGGTIHFEEGGHVINCTFVNNTGGDISFWRGGYSAVDCIFDSYPNGNYYYTTFLNVNDLTVNLGENTFLVANLCDIRGPSFSKVITFNIEGVEYNVTTDSQGFAYLNVKDYLTKEGIYNVGVIFAGDEVNYHVSKNVTVTVTNYNTKLEVNNLTVNVGEGVLTARLSDMNGQLYGKTITFTIEGVDYNIVTDNDGLAMINIKDYLNKEGSYDINFSYTGDEYSNPVLAIAHVVINKYDPILDVDDLSIIQGEDGFLEVMLSDARGILTNKRIKFTINGNDYYGTTDLNGVAKLNIKDILTQLGSYTVNVSFEGDDSTNPASKVVNVLINSLKANLTVRQDGIYYGDTNLTFRLINSKTNSPISDATILLAFSNGISINITTDAQGIASYEIPFIPGIYNLTAKVINMDYSDINTIRLNDLTVSKFRGQIELTQTDDCRALKVKLYNPDTGDVFKNLTVILKFSTGRTVSIITDGEGVSQYYMDFNEGEYSLIASVDNQFSEFENASLGNIIINNKENSEVDFSWHVLEFDYLSAGEIFVIVKGGTVNIDDISVLNQPDAQITFKNNKITVSNLTAGNHVLSVKTTPDASHNSISRTLDIKVNKIYSALNMIDSTSFDYGDSANINLDFDGCDISKDNIYVIGHPEAIISFEDNVLTVSNLPAGEYTLSVTTVPDSNHMAVTRNVSITVNKVESDITFDDSIAFDWGSYSPINVYLKGCTFKFNDIEVIDHSEAVIRVSSNMIRISNLTVGDYKLRVTTTPDENHKSVTRSVDFIVNKLPSTLNFNRAVSFKYGTYGFTTIDFSDCDVLKDDICIINHPEAIIDYEDKFITVSNLEVGTYILSVTTTPNDNYQSVTRILEVNVNKVDSDIIFSNELNFDYLQSDSVFMTLQGCTVEYENISVVNHTEANITFEDNIVTVSNLNPGNYVLCINTTPDENHNSVTRYLNITVNKIASSINFTTDEIAFDEGSLGSTSVNVNGCNISKECIIVENHPEAVINVTGNMITVSNLTAGNYILRATTNPDENHSSVIRSIYVVVSKIPAKVNFTKDTVIFDYGGVGTVGVIVDGGFVLPKDINVLNYPKTEVYIDNNNDIRIYGLDAGDYTLCVITTPDENHRAFENYINITVNKVNSTINFKNNISFEYGNVGTVEVSVDGGNLLSANVVNHTEADVRVGINQISVSNLNVGRYTLNVTSASDNNHYATSTNLDIIVLKTNSSVTFSGDIVFDYLGSASTFVIVDGGSISRENISIVGYKDAKITYDNNIIGVSGLDAGVYNLTVSTNPDSNHNSVNASINVIVNKISSEIKSYNTIVFNYLNVGSTYITVNGGTLSNTKMEVVNHREANIKYNNNQIKVSNLNPGTYSLRVESIPDKNHNVEVRYIAVTVNKAPVRIIPSDVKLFQLNKGGWAVKVVDSENRPVSGIMVTLKVYTGNKFKTVNVVTNAKGEASYSVRGLSKGTHRIVSSVSHHGYSANPVTSSINIIKPKALKFKLKKNNPTKKATLISFQILDKKTKKGVNGIKVKVKIYTGKKYKSFTLKSKKVRKVKGIIGFTTNDFSAGKHKVVIEPVSLKYSGSGKTTMVIKKSAKKYPKKTFKV